MLKRSRRAHWVRLVTALAVTATMAAACGSDDEDSTSTAAPGTTAPVTTDAPSDATDAPGVTDAPDATDSPDATDGDADTTAGGDSDIAAQVASMIAKDIELPRPTDPVDVGTHDVAVIAAGLASTGPAAVASAIEDALALAGWTAPATGDGKFTPTEQAALIHQAVEDEADAIFLVAITPTAVAASVAEAQDAGIPILCVLCGPDAITEGITNIQGDADAAGYAQAAYVTAMSGGTGNVVVYQNQEFKFSQQQGEESVRALAEICPDCTVETRSLLLAEAREPNAPLFTSLLQDYAEGDLDWVIMPFDGAGASGLATTADQLGRTDFGIVGYGALAPFVDMIGTGIPETARASVTISTPYYGWSAVDEAARILAGEPTWDASAMPVALITKDNFDTYPVGQPYLFPEFDFAEFFGGLWGK